MKLSPKGKKLVNRALTINLWNLEILAEKSDLSISTVKKFSSCKDIGKKSFVIICNALELDWEIALGQSSEIDYSYRELSPEENQATFVNDPVVEKNPLERIKEKCRQHILTRYRNMRLLSGEEVRVDQLYVDVYLLERPERKHLNSPGTLLKVFDIETDRLGLSKRIQRNSGFEVASMISKLVILGKPGSGKTTFIKHLAVDWCYGKFQPQVITILIELRKIKNDAWNLLKVIDTELGLENYTDFNEINKSIKNHQDHSLHLQIELAKLKNKIQANTSKKIDEIIEEINSVNKKIHQKKNQLETLPLHSLLSQGKILVLLDGLDEVPNQDLRSQVQNQLQNLSNHYSKSRFILTCRTQIMSNIPEGFMSVEVAEFNTYQVHKFIKNWFKLNGNSNSESEGIWQKLNKYITDNPEIRELTKTPVLLSLMCLVFKDEGYLYTDRTWLYKKGIRLLLSQWNDNKQIPEWEISADKAYRRLRVEDKERLLIEIAAHKFEDPKNFVLFEQDELVSQIMSHLKLTIPQQEIAILKAIESHHGLLVKSACIASFCAVGIWP